MAVQGSPLSHSLLPFRHLAQRREPTSRMPRRGTARDLKKGARLSIEKRGGVRRVGGSPQFRSSRPLGQSLTPSQAGTHRPFTEQRNSPGQAGRGGRRQDTCHRADTGRRTRCIRVLTHAPVCTVHEDIRGQAHRPSTRTGAYERVCPSERTCARAHTHTHTHTRSFCPASGDGRQVGRSCRDVGGCPPCPPGCPYSRSDWLYNP